MTTLIFRHALVAWVKMKHHLSLEQAREKLCQQAGYYDHDFHFDDHIYVLMLLMMMIWHRHCQWCRWQIWGMYEYDGDDNVWGIKLKKLSWEWNFSKIHKNCLRLLGEPCDPASLTSHFRRTGSHHGLSSTSSSHSSSSSLSPSSSYPSVSSSASVTP